MKLVFTTKCILLVCVSMFYFEGYSGAYAIETANNQSVDSPTKADACSSCHNSIVNLKGRGVDVIIKQTKAIQSAEKPHPPAGIKELCDEDIATIAEFLDKA